MRSHSEAGKESSLINTNLRRNVFECMKGWKVYIRLYEGECI